jgi:hypothetical protein
MLFGAGLTGVSVQSNRYYQNQPAKSENGNSPRRAESITNARSDPDNDKAKKKSEGNDGFKATDWLLVLFNGLLTLFTYLLYRATQGLFTETAGLRTAADQQAADMKASIKAATDAANAAIASNQISVYNAERELRAYVFVKNMTSDRERRHGTLSGSGHVIPGAVHTYRFNIIWENSAPTPARNLVTNFNCRSFPDQMPEDFDFPDLNPASPDVIGPRSILTFPGIDISADVFEASIAQKLRWYAWAWIEYDDVFEGTPRHRTEWCCEITVRRHPVTNEIGIGFPIHGKFNGADGDGFLSYDGHANKYARR